jgi:hypothetical protein
MNREDERIERTLTEHLGAGAELNPARRARLLDAVLAEDASRRRPRLIRWAWVPALAAAAVVAIVVLTRPPRRPEPIPPTAILADLLGPFADVTPAAEETAPEETPLEGALALLGGGLDAPVAIGRTVLETSETLTRPRPAPEAAASRRQGENR